MAMERTPWLQHLWLELTSTCNLRCVHCYADSGPERPLQQDMAVDDWKHVLSEARELGCGSVQFIGGEPTIAPSFTEILRHSSEIQFDQIEVFTNASRMTDDILEALCLARADVACSFYSSSAETHNAITASKSFRRTLTGIDRVLSSGLSLRVALIELEANEGHADDARALLEGRGVTPDRISFDAVRPVGRGGSRDGLSPTAGLCGQCWKGRLCVTPTGTAYPCIMSRHFPVGNVLEHSLSEIVLGHELCAAREDLANADGVAASCTPDDCTPNRYCGPDGLCGPGKTRENVTEQSLSCTPDDCTPNRYCGPDGLCGPGRVYEDGPAAQLGC